MTAITFPLKKFPGQVNHNNIRFTGKISIHPIILCIIVGLHSTILLLNNISLRQAAISYVPILYMIAVTTFYLLKFRSENFDYFGLSHTELRHQFNNDKKFFIKAYSWSVLLSIITWIWGVQNSSSPIISKLVVNASILVTFFTYTVVEGLYSRKRVVKYGFFLVLITVFYWSVLSLWPLLDLVLGPVIIYYQYRHISRIESYTMIKLLKNIIK